MIGRPAARWRTLIFCDFIRVPRPAARTITSRSSVMRPHPFNRPAIAVVQPEDGVGERGRVVPHVVPLGDDVAEERRDAELADRPDVELHRTLVLRRILLED